jgi:hypothetical protein
MPDWNDVWKEINGLVAQLNAQSAVFRSQASVSVDIVRRKYLAQLFGYTKRNVIAYYSGFLSKPGIELEEINDEDKNGFMMAVHNLDRSQGLDLILHTPGGSVAATQSLVDYLHKMFGNDIRAIVPQVAMSAGTMLACSCKSIVMAKHSNLGPIDPHLAGVPAHGVIREFRRACAEVKRDRSRAAIWGVIIGQYRPTFLSQCQNAITWSEQFVREQLASNMFKGRTDAKGRAAAVVKKLTDYKGNKTHSRHIHADECHAMGLRIERLEADSTLQDLVLTVHHCYMHSLMNTPSFKMIENHLGTAFVKQQAVVQVQQKA